MDWCQEEIVSRNDGKHETQCTNSNPAVPRAEHNGRQKDDEWLGRAANQRNQSRTEQRGKDNDSYTGAVCRSVRRHRRRISRMKR
jgi:hypothetical protein